AHSLEYVDFYVSYTDFSKGHPKLSVAELNRAFGEYIANEATTSGTQPEFVRNPQRYEQLAWSYSFFLIDQAPPPSLDLQRAIAREYQWFLKPPPENKDEYQARESFYDYIRTGGGREKELRYRAALDRWMRVPPTRGDQKVTLPMCEEQREGQC